MNKLIINKYWIAVSMIAFAVMSILLIVKIYDLTLQDTKRNHQQQQMQMAKTAVQGIRYYIDHLVGDLNLLATQLNNPHSKSDDVKSILKNFVTHYKEDIVKSIFITDVKNFFYSKGDSLPRWVNSELEEMKKNNSSVYFSDVLPFDQDLNNTDLYFLIIVKDSGKSESKISFQATGESIRFCGYLVSFDNLMLQFINPLKLGKSDFAWILDGEGRLIYHPRHEKMLFRSITETSSECTDCHSSFDMQKGIISGNTSVGEYIIGDEPPKIMAYVPINFQDKKWVLVISTLLPEVTADLREKFQYFFILGFVILVGFISFGFVLHHINLKRIRAEEAKRNLEQIQEYQEQLNQASKLASIGELVDTVAHEINTPVGIIAAHADALRLQKTLSEPIDEELNIIKKQAKRISDYTKRLLNYSQRMPFQPEPTNIKELIDECVYLLGHRFREKKIIITKDIQSSLQTALVDKRQMEQVFINLMNNAIDVVDSRGEITIKANNVLPENEIIKNGKTGGVIVSIGDNGCGIFTEDLKKIFNPFYSTKPPSKGTGLGLYIAKSIIQRHKGEIEAFSKEGEGTVFKIFLPTNNIN